MDTQHDGQFATGEENKAEQTRKCVCVYLAHERQVELDSSSLGYAVVEGLHPVVLVGRNVSNKHQSVLQ